MIKKKIRAVVYTRVSTGKDEQKNSFEAQKQYYKEYCEKMGYDLVKIYADEGLTGTNNKRKEFLEMMKDAGLSYTYGSSKKLINFDKSKNNSLFDLIIVKDVSRFARNTDVMRAAKLLNETGVYILFENNNLITKKEGWQFELNLYLTFAERESEDRSRKMKWARKYKATQEKYHFARVPFGYQHNKENDKYEINEKEAAIVREMFKMYAYKNKGMRLIADWLIESGVENRTAKINGRWHDSTIGRMLSNPIYKGDVILGQYENNISGSGVRKKKDKSEWIVLKNAIPAIVSRELYEAAQCVRETRRAKVTDNTLKGLKTSNNIFHHKIQCTKCYSHFVKHTTKKVRFGEEVRETTYFCNNRRKYKSCDMRGVSHSVLEREIWKSIPKIKKHYEKVSMEEELKFKTELLQWLDEKEINAQKEIGLLRNKIKVIDAQTNKLIDSFLTNNENAPEAVKIKLEQLGDEKGNLQDEILAFNTIEIEKQRQEIINQYNKVIRAIDNEYNTFEEIVDMIDAIEVEEEKQFSIWYKVESVGGIYTKERLRREGRITEKEEKGEIISLFNVNVKY